MNESRFYPTYGVGFSYKNKQGLDVVVVEYRGRKDIVVEFKMDGARKNTTGSYIKKGLPMHPTFGKPFVGQTFPCHDGDTVEILEIYSNTKIRVMWTSDGAEAFKELASLRQGHNRHPTKNRPESGAIYKTNQHGNVRVIEFNNATNVLVEFEDGARVTTTISDLNRGSLAYPTRSIRIGQEFTTNSGWKGVPIEYKDAFNVLVKWQDGSSTWHSANHIKNGSIKPLMQPSVAGVGYVGVGRFAPSSHINGEHAPDKIYAYWMRMITRCYNEKEQKKPSSRAYIDKWVREDWHNFQNFAEWALTQPNWDYEDFELDKDLLVTGNKIYSADTCCFLPADINTFLSSRDSGKFLRGVSIINPKTPNSSVGYVARCHVGNERKYLGFYKTEEEAHSVYKQFKEQCARDLAEKWKDKITEQAYSALRAYEVIE